MDSHKSAGDKNAAGEVTTASGRRLRFYHRPNDQNMFKCQRCQRKFFTSYALAKHMEGHHGMQSHKCIQCNLDFKTKKALYRHTAEHVHECDECGRKYRSKEQLESHKKFHSKGKELICDICGRHFSKNSSLKRHLEEHAHNPKYQCPECGKSFRRQADLQTHQWLHKGDGFPCEDCGKAFGTKQHLIWHSYIHYAKPKTEGDIKLEKSETDMTDEGTTETESKAGQAAASESESTTRSGSPRKKIKKEKQSSSESSEKKEEGEKEKQKEQKGKDRKRTPSPQKKSATASEAKKTNVSEGSPKKSNSIQKEIKLEKIKKEKDVDEKKQNATDTDEKKLTASPSKAKKTPKKGAKRKSKGRRKSKKPNVKDSEEPTDNDSKAVTETESERDTSSEKQPGDKLLTTEEVLLSDDVLQDSNELHDEKELRVDTVMFDDIEDDVELDINAAIETLTKLGSHTDVNPETFDEVVIDDEDDAAAAAAAKTMTDETVVASLEALDNMEAADKDISHVDIQNLYEMETDNDTGAETEAQDASKGVVFCGIQTNPQQSQDDLNALTHEAQQVISDTSAAIVIESEIVTQAERLIQTGLYVQNVMGAQDCSSVLEALSSVVQSAKENSEMIVESQPAGDNTPNAPSSSDLAATDLQHIEPAPVEMITVPIETQTDEVLGDPLQQLASTGLMCVDTIEGEMASQPQVVQDGEKDTSANPSSETEPVQLPEEENPSGEGSTKTECTVSDLNISASGDKSETVTVQGNDAKSDDKSAEKCCDAKQNDPNDATKQGTSGCLSQEVCGPRVEGKEENCAPLDAQTKCVSGSYIAEVQMINETLSQTDGNQCKDETGKLTDGKACTHMDVNEHGVESVRPCVGGCSKCSFEFGLSINKTVCPHSKELKVLIEKLDFKGVGDNGEVLLPAAKSGEPSQVGKRRRTSSTDHTSQPGSAAGEEPPPAITTVCASPSRALVGTARLRRRIRHASNGQKSVSTKCCDTRKKESQPSQEPTPPANDVSNTDNHLEGDTPRVTTRSSNVGRGARALRTGQAVKDWKKSPPSVDKKHGRKFTSSEVRRKSDSDQLSPPPQYKVSTLTDLTIRITTQNSPETSPNQQKKSPSSKDLYRHDRKLSASQHKEDSALRQVHGATQELCVVVDDINELVLLQQERLRKMKNFKPVKMSKKSDDHRRRHRSTTDITPEIETAPKPIKILLKLPKDRIKKHERRMALLDKQMGYTADANITSGNSPTEYQQPDSSQDMQRERGSPKRANVGRPHKSKGHHRSEELVKTVAKGASNGPIIPEQLPRVQNLQGDNLAQNPIIGTIISLNKSVLSVEECDSTSMAENHRHANSSASSRQHSGTPPEKKQKQGSRRKASSASSPKDSSAKDPKAAQDAAYEPLDLTVRYKDLSDSDVKPDPDQVTNDSTEEDPMDADTESEGYCKCEDDDKPSQFSGNKNNTNNPGLSTEEGLIGASPFKVKEDPEGTQAGDACGGSRMEGVCGENETDLTATDPHPELTHTDGLTLSGAQTLPAENQGPSGEEQEGAAEFIEVMDRGIQCELGDELLFMPDVLPPPPQPTVINT